MQSLGTEGETQTPQLNLEQRASSNPGRVEREQRQVSARQVQAPLTPLTYYPYQTARGLKMDVASAHHRCVSLSPPTFGIQAALDSALAVAQDFGIVFVHSKCCFFLVG